MLRPLLAALVVIREHNSVRAIPHPIHKAQRHVVQKILVQMILQQDKGAAHTSSFLQKAIDVFRVVKNINKDGPIKRIVRMRKR